MVKLDEKSIHDLPVHDADFIGLTIEQEDSFAIILTIHLLFNKEELDGMEQIYTAEIVNNASSITFKNCQQIEIVLNGSRAHRDEIDYIEIIAVGGSQKRIVVHLISGSLIRCMSESVELAPPASSSC